MVMQKRPAMRTTPRHIPGILAAALVLAAAAMLAGCGPKTIGYGLVLWSEPEGPFSTGEVVRVVQESHINDTYWVKLEGRQDLLEIPVWRVRLHKDLQAATEDAERYQENLNRYAVAQRDGLPLREEPNVQSRQVYRLREGQVVKVVGKSEQPDRVADYESYWYQVLTEDGSAGYCFGQLLTVFAAEGDPHAEAQRLLAADPMLEIFFDTVWRPESFADMTASGRIDLRAFGPQIGLFPDRAKRQLLLVTPRYRQSYTYQQVESAGSNRYVFTGTDVRLTMTTPTRLVLSYTRAGQIVSAVYVAFEGNVEEIVAAEQERRTQIYQDFLRRGRLLTSSAYGDIRLQEGNRFSWKGFGRLADQVFIRPVAGNGTVDFPYFLSEGLRSRFDGIITLRFDEYRDEESTSFLYKFDGGGVRFVFIRREDIQNLEAVRLGLSPPVLYFSFSQ